MRDNKSFCVLPFIHLAADPAGQIKPCCTSHDTIKKSTGEAYNLGYDSIADIYNSDDYLEIRRKMVAGETVSGCIECYEQESAGGKSQRMLWNEKWSHSHMATHHIEQTISNDCVSELDIRYIDLRLGNMCNLKCRSCDSINSSQLTKEITEIAYTNERILDYMPLRAVSDDWYQTIQFKNNLDSIKDTINLVYMTGGEPTLIPENIDYLQSIVDNNRAHEVVVQLNTNLTNAKPEFLSVLKHFHRVRVYASIDGFGDMQNYLRSPAQYDVVKANLMAYSMLSNAVIEVVPVIQAYNVNLITDLFEDLIKIQTENMSIVPIVLLNPRHLSITVLPEQFKRQTRAQISSWLSKNIVCNSVFQLRMHQAMTMLETPDNPQELKRFLEFTKIFDTHRGHNLVDANPELAHAIGYK